MPRRAASLMSLAWRESRTARRRLLLYMSSIALGVAALVAIDSFSDNVIDSVHDQSRALLGGDLELRARDTLPSAGLMLLDSLRHDGFRTAGSMAFSSMALVRRTGGTRLIQVHAVGPGYPFYGDMVTAPRAAWSRLQDSTNAIVDPSLLVSLHAAVGDSLTLGNETFLITGSLESVPGDVGITAAIAPRVYIPERFVPATHLVVFGSRAEREVLIKLPPGQTAAPFSQAFSQRFRGMGLTLVSAGYNESRLADTIDQLHNFLSIVGLVALLLGGIGVASGVHAFVMRKIEPVAVLRCLGATSWQVLALYTGQAALMGLVGATIGAALGVGLQFLLPRALHAVLPMAVDVHIEPIAVGFGLAIGVWVALVFALRPLLALRRISPLQALRRESDAAVLRAARLDPLRGVVSVAIIASVLALTLQRADTLLHGVAFAAGIGLAIGILWACAAALSWAAHRAVTPSWPFTIKQGVASLYRPGNQTRAVVLAIGFGVFLVGTLYQVQHSVLSALSGRIAESRANVVFFDVQQDQHAGVDSIMRSSGTQIIEETPIVPMRISAINGTPVADLLRSDSVRRAAESATAGQNRSRARGRWRSRGMLRREFRSTYRDTLMGSERVVAGRWFRAHRAGDAVYEVSLDQGAASEMQVALGDTITWNVQGVPIVTRVTSLREVKWASFEPNFFAVFETAGLKDAPQQFAVLGRSPSRGAVAQVQSRVVSAYPTISSLDLTLVQTTVADVLAKVTTAMRFLAFLSLGLGIPVLFSAVSATRRERLREGVLLKTLGATKRQIGRMMFAEYALLGILGAATGIVLSTLAGWALLHWIFRSRFAPAVWPALLVALVMILISVSIGLLTGRDVFAETPMAALREN
jgi:putative ABC transport system permease protein